ncbi:hypothetical protein GCM10009133_18920 [Cocleimonas flava]|uniref:Uncharacterized protein n=1 Tax=Cocleimonas flava TaxID=634765 RepID=A0A4R1ET69_9GAMM|nr:hypothetical protein [Cocleimonas flava]TCJ84816.1 hypothetical protein EV695_2777 [Cocleimonas flava]
MKLWYTYFLKVLPASALMLISPLAFAASAASEKISWMTMMFIGIAISLVVATILSIRNKNAEGFTMKFLFGGVYFWAVAFIQLLIFAAYTHFSK